MNYQYPLNRQNSQKKILINYLSRRYEIIKIVIFSLKNI